MFLIAPAGTLVINVSLTKTAPLLVLYLPRVFLILRVRNFCRPRSCKLDRGKCSSFISSTRTPAEVSHTPSSAWPNYSTTSDETVNTSQNGSDEPAVRIGQLPLNQPQAEVDVLDHEFLQAPLPRYRKAHSPPTTVESLAGTLPNPEELNSSRMVTSNATCNHLGPLMHFETPHTTSRPRSPTAQLDVRTLCWEASTLRLQTQYIYIVIQNYDLRVLVE